MANIWCFRNQFSRVNWLRNAILQLHLSSRVWNNRVLSSVWSLHCVLHYAFVTGLLSADCIAGGWDDENLEAFHKAAKLSGPSKFIVWPLYRIVDAICKHSPLHNKFRMSSEEAFKEAEELLQLKNLTKLRQFNLRIDANAILPTI